MSPRNQKWKKSQRRYIVNIMNFPTPLSPLFADREAVAMSCSGGYAAYLLVYLNSIKKHVATGRSLDVVIFERNIKPLHKQAIIDFLCDSKFSVRFFNPESLLEDLDLYISHSYFSRECYYRLCAPVVLREYRRLIFTDIDLIAKGDISELFNFDMKGKPLAACKEILWRELYERNQVIKNFNVKKYTDEVLKLPSYDEYCNTGVLLIDVEKCDWKKSFEEIISWMKGKRLLFQEQCALNSIFRGQIAFLPPEWNFEFATAVLEHNEPYYQAYFNLFSKAKIYHFLGSPKPWKTMNTPISSIWWEYARNTPFYEEILYENIKNDALQIVRGSSISNMLGMVRDIAQLSYYRLKLKNMCIKIKTLISWGKRRQRYLNRKKEFEEKAKTIKKFLESV